MDQQIIINRNVDTFARSLQQGKQFKTSNRDDVLLGKEDEVANKTNIKDNFADVVDEIATSIMNIKCKMSS